MTTPKDVNEQLDVLSRTALSIADERNMYRRQTEKLVATLREALDMLDNVYDVDEPELGHFKESPFSGAGLLMTEIRQRLAEFEAAKALSNVSELERLIETGGRVQ